MSDRLPHHSDGVFEGLVGTIDGHRIELSETETALRAQIGCMEPVMKLHWEVRNARKAPDEPLGQLLKLVELQPQGLELTKELERLGVAVHSQWHRDFPVLHGLVTIGIWAQVEACVRDLLSSWLKAKPAVLQRRELTKLKVPASILGQSDTERYDSLVEAIEQLVKQEQQGKHRLDGIEVLELMLGKCGLGEPPDIDTDLRRDLVELWALRNLLAHRAGRVDAIFRARVPWRKLDGSSGSGWSYATALDVARYFKACKGYLHLLSKRLDRAYPVS